MGLRRRKAGQTISLARAYHEGLVDFELRGVSEGVTSNCRLVVTKKVDEPLRIAVPPGTMFLPTGDDGGADS